MVGREGPARVTNFERECRRARLLVACQHLSDEIDKREYVDNIMATLEGYAGRLGYYAETKHPWDTAAEIEEEWRFAKT